MSKKEKNSAYPVTVQPGIPKLQECPSGWKCTSLKSYLYEDRRPVKLSDNVLYNLVTVKRGRGGIVVRESLEGKDIAVKSQFNINKGDFLISKRQIVHGACGLVPESLEGSIVSNEYAVMRGNDNIDLTYLNYLAHSIYFQQTCFHSSIGIHIEKMIFKVDKWLKWKFNIPPLPEQRKIADILSTWDKAIETQEKLIANSEKIKKSLMQQLLTGKKRLKGFSGVWEEYKVSDLGKIGRGRVISKLEMLEQHGEFPVYSSQTSNNGVMGHLDTYDFEGEYITWTTDGVHAGTVFYRCGKFNCTNVCGTINPYATIAYPLYLSKSLSMEAFKHVSHTLANPKLMNGVMASIKLTIPPLPEQIAIANILSDSDKEIALQKQKLKILKQEKSALMQQLLTGKKRVKIDALQEEVA